MERAHRARAAPMIALMGLAAVAVVAVVTLTTQSRAVEMVSFPQDDLGILREMVSSKFSVDRSAVLKCGSSSFTVPKTPADIKEWENA